jgi:WD40 repeat protein
VGVIHGRKKKDVYFPRHKYNQSFEHQEFAAKQNFHLWRQMRQNPAGSSMKQRKALRVSSFLECGPLPVKDLCGIILDYSQYFEGERGLVLNGHTSKVTALVVLHDGKLASGSRDKTVRVWENGVCLLTLAGHTSWVTALAVLPDVKCNQNKQMFHSYMSTPRLDITASVPLDTTSTLST